MIPKFRAWHKKEKRMFDMDMLRKFEFSDNYWKATIWHPPTEMNAVNTEREPMHRFIIDNENAILMQSTALKDKNGKEIFEGDIFKHPENGIGDVFLSDDRATWEISYCEEIGDIDLYLDAKEGEVIGNIHKNPELLGKEK